jgi:hypothetical protein
LKLGGDVSPSKDGPDTTVNHTTICHLFRRLPDHCGELQASCRDVFCAVRLCSFSWWLHSGRNAGSSGQCGRPDRDESVRTVSSRTPLWTIAVKYQLAIDYAAVGNLDKTIELAQEVARAEQGFDFPLDGAFKLLGNCPDFLRIADDVHALYPPVHHSVSAFTFDDRMLIPEGLAYDERTQSFLMGSLNEKRIVRYTQDGLQKEFVPAGRDGLAEVPVSGWIQPMAACGWLQA